MYDLPFFDLVGKIFTEVYHNKEKTEVYFVDTQKRNISYQLQHRQDCCEIVWLDDIVGDLSDLCNTPILMAYEASNHDEVTEAIKKTDKWTSSVTWTFYHLATIKGYVTLRWVGNSNGYYSEYVHLSELEFIPKGGSL